MAFLRPIRYRCDFFRVRSRVANGNRIRLTHDTGASCKLKSATANLNASLFLPLDEVVAYRAAFVIVSGSDGRAEMFLEPAK